MKFFHLADLHIGKNVNGFSMLRDQRYVLEQVLAKVEEEQPEAVLLAGDIYDRSLPPTGAVALLDWFLTELAVRSVPCLAVAGNHDSGVRLSFGSELLRKNNVYLVGTVTEQLVHLPFERNGVRAEVWMLPFVRPAEAAEQFPSAEIKTTADGVRAVLSCQQLQPDTCHLLVAHQFVIGGSGEPERSDSETMTVGGVDQVECEAFEGFDYVALGHLHGPQRVGVRCRYAGSPLQYSFSELHQQKGITVVEVLRERKIQVSQIPLRPLHPMREIRGPLEELIQPEITAQGDVQDYIHVTLTDELEPENALARLRAVYPNVMKLDFDNQRTHQDAFLCTGQDWEDLSMESLFCAFYEQQNGRTMEEPGRTLMQEVLETVGGELLCDR